MPSKAREPQDLTAREAGRGDNVMTTYNTRYAARKAASGGDVVVKVCGGYAVMTASDYNTWRRQK